MSIDLFLISGVIDEIKTKIISIEKIVMEEPNSEDIDWGKVYRLAETIVDSAEVLQDEVDEEL